MNKEFAKTWALEAVVAKEATAEANASYLDDAKAEAEMVAFLACSEATRAAAEIALHWRSKVSQEAHDSAEINAYDTLYENGIDPNHTIGRLAFNRFYVAQLDV